MPQLDNYSYLSQVFWLIFFFLLFYAVVMYSILPSLYKAIRLRQRKLELMDSQKGNIKDEESSISAVFDQSLADSFVQSRKSLETCIAQTNLWMESNAKKLNNSELYNANKMYLSSVQELAKEKMAFKKMTQSGSI